MVKPNKLPPAAENETLRTIFAAIVDYHNNLTQTRFTIAGLYIAATSLLASSWFSGSRSKESSILIPLVGLFFNVICWLLEIRTRHLLKNVSRKGMAIERLLGVRRGFFALMNTQPYPADIPFADLEMDSIVGHTSILNLLYVTSLFFW